MEQSISAWANDEDKVAMLTAARNEITTIARFVLVGLVNTVIGYGIILGCLFLSVGDYAANAIGFALGMPLAHALHRRFTFRAPTSVRRTEFAQFAVVVIVAYCANVAVVAVGRQLGYVNSPLIQLLAILTYAAVLYVLNRLIVFRGADMASAPRN